MSNNQQQSKKAGKRAWNFISSESVWMDETLPMDAIIVWHILAIYAHHKTRLAYPSAATIQRIARMGRHRVNVAVKALIKAGAISRELKRRKLGTAIYGSQSYYTVMPLNKWVTRKHVLEKPGGPVPGGAKTGLPGISNEQVPTIEQVPTHELKPKSTPQLALGSRLSLTLPETEDLLAGLGIGDDAVAAFVFGKLDTAGWLDPFGVAFPNRKNLEAFMARLGENISARRQGDRPPTRTERVSMAPIATGSHQGNDGEDGYNDGPQDS